MPPHTTRKNAFLSDVLLFRLAAQLPSGLLAGFEDVGGFVASREGRDLSRLANCYRPRLRREWERGGFVEQLEQHPSYHALQRRSRQVGLASSLWEESGAENGCRYQARAVRLALIAGLETGHLNEITTLSAASAVLLGEADLFHNWQNILLSRQYDFSSRPALQKKAGSLACAFTDVEEQSRPLVKAASAHKISYDDTTNRDLYRINASKTNIIQPMADGYFVSADVDGYLSCFLVPRFQESGAMNGMIRVEHLIDRAGERSVAEGQVTFFNSHGWLLGQVGDGARVIKDMDTMICFDHAVISAGVLRAALQYGVDFYRESSPKYVLSSLTERIFADIALDVAGAQALVMRLAKAFDKAAHDRSEAAFARIMTPIIACHINQLVVPILGEIIAQVGDSSFMEGGLLSQMFFDVPVRLLKGRGGNDLVGEIVQMAHKAPGLFQQLLEKIAVDIGSAGPGTVGILKTAIQVAATDGGAGRLFVEQMAYAASAAALSHCDIESITNAYIESRLGGQWRSSYGMLSARHNAGQILQALYPAA